MTYHSDAVKVDVDDLTRGRTPAEFVAYINQRRQDLFTSLAEQIQYDMDVFDFEEWLTEFTIFI
jgi:hypothetical protein